MTKDQIEYKQYLNKLNDMADSRRNMKIDMRPRVLMRTMRLELIIFGAAMCACVAMPLYFLKFKKYQEKYMEEYQLKKDKDAE